ncbi:hypothetical protein DFH07DRAFT_705984, partial [Mycena maculata]
ERFGSDVLHLDVFRTSIINSYRAVNELLEKRSAIYYERPKLTMATELMRWGNSIFFQRYSESSPSFGARGRYLFHEQSQPSVAIRIRPQQMGGAHKLLLRLLESPMDFSEHIRHMVGSLAIDVLPHDPLIEVTASTLDAVVFAATPGTFPVDFVPILNYTLWFPG